MGWEPAKDFAVIGPMRSGKDTVADYFVRNHNYKRLAFADNVKRECADMLTHVTGQEVTIRDINDNKIRYRGLLQWWGTEFRRHDNPNYWLEYLESQLVANSCLDQPENIVVTDARFMNEIDLLRRKGFLVIELVPDETLQGKVQGEYMNHPSEQEWKQCQPDYVFPNEYMDFGTLVEHIEDVVL